MKLEKLNKQRYIYGNFTHKNLTW